MRDNSKLRFPVPNSEKEQLVNAFSGHLVASIWQHEKHPWIYS